MECRTNKSVKGKSFKPRNINKIANESLELSNRVKRVLEEVEKELSINKER